MTVDVKTCTLHDTLDDAARIMWDHDCGCVPVIGDDGKVAGMITDRDVCMSGWIQGRPLSELRVAIAMSDALHACGPRDSLEQARSIMKDRRVRRLPVVDPHGRIVGILSLNDLALAAVNHPLRASEWVTTREVGETLAAVCRPHGDIAVTPTSHAPVARQRTRAKPGRELGASS
jgi:CBS-domain-containing membrane protein